MYPFTLHTSVLPPSFVACAPQAIPLHPPVPYGIKWRGGMACGAHATKLGGSTVLLGGHGVYLFYTPGQPDYLRNLLHTASPLRSITTTPLHRRGPQGTAGASTPFGSSASLFFSTPLHLHDGRCTMHLRSPAVQRNERSARGEEVQRNKRSVRGEGQLLYTFGVVAIRRCTAHGVQSVPPLVSQV